jgi:hypothetical protein
MGWPVSAFHSRTVVSALALASRCPSGLNATLSTPLVWPVNGSPRGVYSDVLTGTSTKEQRPGLTALLDYARPGDTIVVVGIDRPGRNAAEVMLTIRDLGERGIVIRSLREGIDTSNATGRMIAGVLASLAELELELQRERRSAAKAARKSRGLPIGRPKALDADQIALAEFRKRGLKQVSCDPSVKVTPLTTILCTRGSLGGVRLGCHFPTRSFPAASSATSSAYGRRITASFIQTRVLTTLSLASRDCVVAQSGGIGSPGHNSRYSMSGEIDSCHCLRLMLLVSLSHSICGVAMAGQIRTVVSVPAEASLCPSGLNATPSTQPV